MKPRRHERDRRPCRNGCGTTPARAGRRRRSATSATASGSEFTWTRRARRGARAGAGPARERGVQRGDTVVLISENRPELYWAEWAAMALGAKVVALYPDAGRGRGRVRGSDAQAVCVFAEDQEQVDKVLPVARRDHGDRHRGVVGVGRLVGSTRHAATAVVGCAAAAPDDGCMRRTACASSARCRRAQAGDIARALLHLGHHRQAQGRDQHARSADAQRPIARRPCWPCRKACEYLSYIPLSWATEQWMGVDARLDAADAGELRRAAGPDPGSDPRAGLRGGVLRPAPVGKPGGDRSCPHARRRTAAARRR